MLQAGKEASFDVERVRADFPTLQAKVWCKDLVYLDSAASAQKPQAVLDALDWFYREHNSNVHRGVHYLSATATQAFEETRRKAQAWIGAAEEAEIVFTRGTTEAVNLVAQSYGRPRFGPGDEILITHMEHHSNIVPWQLLCEQTGATLKVAPIGDDGALLMDEFEKLLSAKTRLVSVVHVSNALGTVNPVAEIVAKAHAHGAVVMLDGAQAVPHYRVDVAALDCDFYAFSGHKAFGPTGIGVLYGKRALLEAMPPYQGGGEMIKTVSFQGTTYNDVPHKFEAGTPHIAGVIGLGAALDYLAAVDLEAAGAHEQALLEYATAALRKVEGTRVIGTAPQKASVLAFVLEGAHPHDIGTILDREGVAVRTGHHCAQPVMERFGVPATTRASLAFYNNRADIDTFIAALRRVRELLFL